jgi:hypothetical protein
MPYDYYHPPKPAIVIPEVVKQVQAEVDRGLRVIGQAWNWKTGFRAVLARSEEENKGLPSGEVWQDRFSAWWHLWFPFEEELRDVEDKIDDLIPQVPDKPTLRGKTPREAAIDLAYLLHPLKSIPREAMVGNMRPLFRDHPDMGRQHIAYSVEDLNKWDGAFRMWLSKTQDQVTELNKLLSKYKYKPV